MSNAHHDRPDDPHRGAPAHRRRGGRRAGAERLVVGADVPRHRDDPASAAIPARRGSSPSASAASARRCTPSPRCGRSRTRSARDPAERAVHPQPDRRRARDARPHRALLPPVGPRLGGRRLGAQGRPGEGGGAGREPVGLAGQQPKAAHRRCKDRLAGFVDARAARHLHQRLLGPPGDEAAARGEPARRRALPAGARGAAEGQPGRRDPRRQDAEHPEPGGRRRGQRHQPGQRGHPEHGEAVSGRRTSSTR